VTPALLATFFSLSAWGTPCPAPSLLPIRIEWESPYLKTVYAADCGGELREIIVAADWYGQRYGITYLAGSEWLRGMPDVENWARPEVDLPPNGAAGTVDRAGGARNSSGPFAQSPNSNTTIWDASCASCLTPSLLFLSPSLSPS
jgi:hypothetical protein